MHSVSRFRLLINHRTVCYTTLLPDYIWSWPQPTAAPRQSNPGFNQIKRTTIHLLILFAGKAMGSRHSRESDKRRQKKCNLRFGLALRTDVCTGFQVTYSIGEERDFFRPVSMESFTSLFTICETLI